MEEVVELQGHLQSHSHVTHTSSETATAQAAVSIDRPGPECVVLNLFCYNIRPIGHHCGNMSAFSSLALLMQLPRQPSALMHSADRPSLRKQQLGQPVYVSISPLEMHGPPPGKEDPKAWDGVPLQQSLPPTHELRSAVENAEGQWATERVLYFENEDITIQSITAYDTGMRTLVLGCKQLRQKKKVGK
jgi:hypothetical protein